MVGGRGRGEEMGDGGRGGWRTGLWCECGRPRRTAALPQQTVSRVGRAAVAEDGARSVPGGWGKGQWRRRYFCRSLVPRLDQGLITLSVPKLPVVRDAASTDGRQGPGDTAASGSVGPPC